MGVAAQPGPKQATEHAVQALNARDYEAYLSVYTPDAVWEMPGLDVVEGREALRRLSEEWIGAYEEFRTTLLDFHQFDGDVTLAVVEERGRPVGSNGHVENEFAYVSVWTDGLIQRVMAYRDIDEARAAAERLAEQRT